MELTYATIAVLASMIFVLAGMVGYLYWQQTHILQHLQSLAIAIATHVENIKHLDYQPEPEPEVQHTEEKEEDDRLTVVDDQPETVEHIEGPPSKEIVEDDVDDLQDKTSTQLKELLTKKGIPFGKRDSKSVLIQLLKASS